MGLSRIVEINTTGGPGFGFEHFKQYDFLRDKEVVLTFDDGPWPKNTAAVLKALTDECLKATFFEIGHKSCDGPIDIRGVFANIRFDIVMVVPGLARTMPELNETNAPLQ